MKKILVMAMVAFAFLACKESASVPEGGTSNPEGASVPKADTKAAKAVTSQAFDLLGTDVATVDKALEDAGFTKVEGGGLLGIAKREQARVRKSVKEEDQIRIMYFYNVPENYQTMSEEESAKYVKGVLDKGECLILVMACYTQDNMLNAFQTSVMAPLKDNINLLFTEISDEEYKKLPTSKSVVNGMPTTAWEGFIRIGDEEDEPYTDHAKFVTKVAKAEAIEVEEQGYAITEMDEKTGSVKGFVYYNGWLNPDADMQAEEIKENGWCSARGAFGVVDQNGVE